VKQFILLVSVLGLALSAAPAMADCDAGELRSYAAVDSDADGDIRPIDILRSVIGLQRILGSMNTQSRPATADELRQFDINKDGKLTQLDLLRASNTGSRYINGGRPGSGACLEVLRAASILDSFDLKNLQISESVLAMILGLENVSADRLELLPKRFDFDRSGKVDAADIRIGIQAYQLMNPVR
jgi:hypothetical protein